MAGLVPAIYRIINAGQMAGTGPAMTLFDFGQAKNALRVTDRRAG